MLDSLKQVAEEQNPTMVHAEPIIFIHGLYQTPYTSKVFDVLAPNPVLVPNLPGYGDQHARHVSEVSVGATADFIHTHMRSLGYERAHIVGHSVGGVVAVVMADRYPKAVASLISVEGNFTLKDAFWTQKLARMSEHEAEAMLAAYRANPETWLVGAGLDATPENLVLAESILAAQPASILQAMARSVVQITAEPAYLQSIAALIERGVPFHLVAGERSRAGWDVPQWALERAASVTIQPNVGHNMMLENQATFLSTVRRLIPA